MNSLYPAVPNMHTRARCLAPPPLSFLAPSTARGPRPKLSLSISSTDTCARYTPSKLPPCEFISPATRQNTFFNKCIESNEGSSEEESSGGEDEDVAVVAKSTRKLNRKKSGSVRFEEAVSIRIITDDWAEDEGEEL